MGVIETENVQDAETKLERYLERDYRGLNISSLICSECKTFHTPLVMSARVGPEFARKQELETLEELLRLFPGEIDTTDPCMFKRTPLHISVDAESFENCEILIKAGANVNIVDANGHTPLAILCLRNTYFNKGSFCSWFRIAKLLIENGADLLSVTMKDILVPLWIYDIYRDVGKAPVHNTRMTVVQLGVDSLPQDRATPKSEPVSFAVGTGAYSSSTTSFAVGNSPVSSGYPRPNELRCKSEISEKQENTDFAQRGRDRLIKKWAEKLDKALEVAIENGKDHAVIQIDSEHGIKHLEAYYKARGMYTSSIKPLDTKIFHLQVSFFGPIANPPVINKLIV